MSGAAAMPMTMSGAETPTALSLATGRQTMSKAPSVTTLSALMTSNSMTVGRQMMTTGSKSTKSGAEAPSQTAAQSPSGDRAAWAAGEWAIVGGRRPAKRARPRVQHTSSIAAHRGAAWAAGEWAMPEGTTKERD
jgi:hypothetical protein